MKQFLYLLAFVLVIITGCSKNEPRVKNTGSQRNRIAVLQNYLRFHAPGSFIDSVDFEHAFVNRGDSLLYMRFAVKGQSMLSDFLIIKVDGHDNVIDATIVHLEKANTDDVPGATTNLSKKQYEGFILLRSIDGKNVFQSAIKAGFMVARHPDLFQNAARKKVLRESSLPMPSDNGVLPEVVVVGYTSPFSGNGYSYTDFLQLESLFEGWSGGGGSGGDSGSNSYPGSYGSGGSDGAGYAYYGATDPQAADADGLSPSSPDIDRKALLLGLDDNYFSPAIDLDAWMKCFTQIPDDGAVCRVTLYGDLPEASDPTAGLNIWSGNTGHCFLQLQKTKGGQSMSQIIGFMAQSAFKAITNTYAYGPSKMIDNGGHTYNCSISMNISAAQLVQVIDQMKTLSAMPYSVVNFDCLDYALAVVNTVRGFNPLVIDKTFQPADPFSDIANGPKLYALLRAMVENGSPESNNIQFGSTLRAGQSHGPCN